MYEYIAATARLRKLFWFQTPLLMCKWMWQSTINEVSPEWRGATTHNHPPYDVHAEHPLRARGLALHLPYIAQWLSGSHANTPCDLPPWKKQHEPIRKPLNPFDMQYPGIDSFGIPYEGCVVHPKPYMNHQPFDQKWVRFQLQPSKWIGGLLLV